MVAEQRRLRQTERRYFCRSSSNSRPLAPQNAGETISPTLRPLCYSCNVFHAPKSVRLNSTGEINCQQGPQLAAPKILSLSRRRVRLITELSRIELTATVDLDYIGIGAQLMKRPFVFFCFAVALPARIFIPGSSNRRRLRAAEHKRRWVK
jgi:hypothetical protein